MKALRIWVLAARLRTLPAAVAPVLVGTSLALSADEFDIWAFVFALLGALGTGLAWVVVVVQTPDTRYAGLAWLAIGFAGYVAYRRFVVHEPLRKTVRAPAATMVRTPCTTGATPRPS